MLEVIIDTIIWPFFALWDFLLIIPPKKRGWHWVTGFFGYKLFAIVAGVVAYYTNALGIAALLGYGFGAWTYWHRSKEGGPMWTYLMEAAFGFTVVAGLNWLKTLTGWTFSL